MRIEFVTKNYTAPEKLKDIITKKLDKFDKYFREQVPVKVMLKSFNDKFAMELTILLDGLVLRTEVYSANQYENIDEALPKLEKQIIKHRAKITDKSKKVSIKELEQSYIPEIHDAVKSKVVRNKKFKLTPMTVGDAIEELELLGHNFYVFFNKETSDVNVLYRRNDNDYGLIDAAVERE
jgi:putative sigma-54 modulation protein